MNKNRLFSGLVMMGALCAPPAYSKDMATTDPEFEEILSQDIGGLTVASVAKRQQRLSDTAAAVYVITQEQIRRAGIYSIPEALRLVPGVQVAKMSGDRWAISSRGFNTGGLNNKMLVLIDGRAVYTPVFSGVYWGDQSTTVNDIERIEVIRGPGASLYGANAVNGVVNIITKSAEDTQGTLLSATATTKGNGIYEGRYGGRIDERNYYRAYGQYMDGDSWYRQRGGFRMDGKNLDNDSYTLQGDAYSGEQKNTSTLPMPAAPFSQTLRTDDDAYGGNVLGRWNHRISSASSLSLQAYVDHYSRVEANATQHVSTADIQLQHSIDLNDRNHFIWGGGGRLYYQELLGSYSANVNDSYGLHNILNVFAQNEFAVVPDTLFFTAGSKLEYNDYTGFEVQPSARLAWHMNDRQTLWGAVSRAVRTPSSIEEDFNFVAQVAPGAPPTESRLMGNPDQKSEELVAYEIGHRIQPTTKLSFDTSLFWNEFNRLQTYSIAGPIYAGSNGNNVLPYRFSNLGEGHTYGAEITANWTVTPDWRLAGSYSYLKMHLEVNPGAALTLDTTEKQSPNHQFAAQSYYNFSDTVHWDNMVYYVSALTPPIDSYVRYDTRIAWMVMPGLEVSFIGRNLVDPHKEFPGAQSSELGRSYIGQVLWKF